MSTLRFVLTEALGTKSACSPSQATSSETQAAAVEPLLYLIGLVALLPQGDDAAE